MTEVRSKRAAVFLDRDGVIVVDHGYAYRPEDMNFIAGAPQAIRHLNDSGFLVIVVTNQSGIARGYFTVPQLESFHAHMARELAAQNARLDDIFWCPYHPDGVVAEFARDHVDRKPGPGMILSAAARHGIDLERSFLIGDRDTDVAAAAAAGVVGHLFSSDQNLDDFVRTILTDRDRRSLDGSASSDGNSGHRRRDGGPVHLRSG
jgi:D-glycero-D-manno-heptose 1,7-bisphosphate phosphatase